MNLDETKILIKNKEHCKAVIERLNELGRDYHTPAFAEEYGSQCAILYNEENNKGGWDERGEDNRLDYKTLTLDDLYEIEKPREKIKLTEHVCDMGNIRFLTEDFKFVNFRGYDNKLFKAYVGNNKLTVVPNARTIYVWADTLEYVKEGE